MKRVFLFSALLLTINVLSLNYAVAGILPSTGQGIAYYRAGFPAVAKPLLISEIQTNPDNLSEICFNLGNIYFSENQPDSASYYFNKGLAADPQNSLNSVGLTMLKIKSDPTAANAEFVSILKLKQNKKNVDMYLAVANAYLFNEVIDQASVYQEKARSMKPKYAPVFVVAGDIEVAKKDLGKACGFYDQAIYFDSKCKEAYIKYARAYKNVQPSLAIEKLNTLKEKEPNFLLADRELADTYYSINNFDKAAELYGVYMQSGNSNIQDLTQYGLVLFLVGKYNESLEVVNMGLAKAPRNPALNRLVMYNYVHMGKTAEALQAAERFFNKTDKPIFTYNDYAYYGKALRDNNNLDLAIVQYEKGIQTDSLKSIDLWKELSDLYSKKKYYGKAATAYDKYFKTLSDDKVNNDILLAYGKANYNMGADTSSLVDVVIKRAALAKADSLFSVMATKFPTSYLGNFWRARTNAQIDMIGNTYNAKTYYELTIAFCEAKNDNRYNQVLAECYRYMGIYYVQNDDVKQAQAYFAKVLLIDPQNDFAKKTLEQLNKQKKK